MTVILKTKLVNGDYRTATYTTFDTALQALVNLAKRALPAELADGGYLITSEHEDLTLLATTSPRDPERKVLLHSSTYGLPVTVTTPELMRECVREITRSGVSGCLLFR